MTSVLYYYVGPPEILEATADQAPGTPVRSKQDVSSWIDSHAQRLDAEGCVTATFTVMQDHELRLADRHSEHVACAGRQPVLAAGEITFFVDGEDVEVYGISNQSTGYCPEPSCWDAVQRSLEQAALPHPNAWTASFNFRLCEHCGQRNIVKEQWFECAVCQEDLPRTWNF